MEYDHFAYGEALASALKAISHTSQSIRTGGPDQPR